MNPSILQSKYPSKEGDPWTPTCCSELVLFSCLSRDMCANSRINYVKQVWYLPGKHLTQSRTALEMSLFKENLLQRDTDQSMNKFPKDMEMYA